MHMLLNRGFFVPLCLICIGRSLNVAQTYRGLEVQSTRTGTGYALCGSCSIPREIASKVWLTANDEPGEPIILSGTIYREDGATPDSGISMFLYQTDSEGYYHRPTENVFHPRLVGWLRTGKDGCYEIHTIKPAPEVLAPKEPAHIHAHVFGKGMPEHFVHEFWFQGDSFISPGDQKRLSQLGTFSPIVTLTKGMDGILRGTRDIRMRPAPAWKCQSD
jgi:protocatechuate 3,4-dioxygenase, beta subunit